jgi:hypothetical protein
MNSKKAITLLVLTTLLFSLLPLVPVKAISGTTAAVHDVVYGDDVLISGTGVTAGAQVEVYWDAVQPWDGEAGKLNSTKAKSSGLWECNVTIPDALVGEHYIWSRDITTGDTDHDATAVMMHPSMKFSPKSGLPNDDIDITGHGFDDEVDIVSILYENVVNITLSTSPSTPETNDLGKWTASFDVPALTYGAYNIYAIDDEGHQAVKSFTVGASITLDIENGPVGSLVQIKGRGFAPGGTIDTGDVTLDGTDCTVEKDDTISGSKYEFTIEVIVPSIGDGEHEFNVTNGVNWATADFDVDEDGGASVKVTPTFGVQGSTVAIHGYNFSQVNDADVVVELWTDTDVYVADIKTYETNTNGEWSGTFKVPAQSNGKYHVAAYQTKYDIDDTADFKIGSVIVILNDDEGPAGLELVLTGTGFEYDSTWNCTFGDELVIEDNADTDSSGNLELDGSVPKFWIPSMEAGVYTITVMDDEGTTVEVEFEITDNTMVETDPLVAPANPDRKAGEVGYNVTIIGKYFSQDEGADLDFVLYNDTDEWDISVYEGDYNSPYVYNADDDGEWEAWWLVDEELYIGTYTLNATDENDMFAQYTLDLVGKTVALEPRKSTFRIGDTVGFNIEHSFGSYDSYIKIWTPDGELYWQTDAFEEDSWIKVGSVVRLPFFEQVAGGNPLVLLDDAPLGTWEWTWYEAGTDEDELDSGTFTVAEAEADILAGQVQDLNNQITDLSDQLGDVQSDFDDVRSDISDVAAIAQQAVDAADRATEAVQTVAQTANSANTAAEAAADAANAAKDAANSLTTLVYGAIGAALVAALAAIVSLMQFSRRIAG